MSKSALTITEHFFAGTVTVSADNPFGEPDSFIDALADSAGCSRDLPNLQSLGVNVIRAYSVNSSLNHDSCMQALSQAGIYTMYVLGLGVSGPFVLTPL